MIGKEVRTLTRDVAQWSQLFLMVALLFLYLYNIRMLPLGGDARATIVAYANLGMAGFVVAAICLRFAYPSVSSEGKAFWMVQSAPVSYRRLLLVESARLRRAADDPLAAADGVRRTSCSTPTASSGPSR